MSCEDGHRPATDPRRVGSCVVCGKAIPPVLPPLPDLTEAFFRDLAEALEASGHIPKDMPAPDFQAFRTQTMHRVRWGQSAYGDRWKGTDTIPEALEELPDAAVYAAGEMGKAGRHGELLAAGFHAYLAYAALRRYMAERDAG